MKFLKKSKKLIIGIIIGLIVGSVVSVYAAYSYLAQDVSYTKSDGTEISVKEALDQLYAKNPESKPAPTTTNYTGYYADVDDDGTVDGVIFIDLAQGASGLWGKSDGGYSYSAVTSGLRSYKISTKTSSYSGKFGTKPVITPSSVSGNARFYVMALSDYNTGTLDRAFVNSITKTVGSVTFRLPRKEEWSAFAGQFGITTSNYSSTYGLAGFYWSSDHIDIYYSWVADFYEGYMESSGYLRAPNNKENWVRLCATF